MYNEITINWYGPGPTEAKNLWRGQRFMDLQNFWSPVPTFVLISQNVGGASGPTAPPVTQALRSSFDSV